MKTYKDVVMVICCFIWITSNIITHHLFGNVVFSNITCIILFGSMVIIQRSNVKFGNWLETPLKK